MSHEAKYHCTPCLDGRHICGVMIPTDWPGATASSRCVCKRCTAGRDVAPKPVFTPDTVAHRSRQRDTVAHRSRQRPGAPVSRWTDDKLAELAELQGQGLTSRQIGERVGAKPDVVRHYLQKARRKGLVAA